ncbi:LysM peptidoglycan-binding domain-containing protein [Chakrabartyella piscis]|uniref:LysM peptidoglycan-binding domain-containing protein n=1 Tax=Chakrabartyella piscis TaxID=2918914 RepID=UPI0029583448|nr:LysM peptidoglycan-binding domain-containing protein [Chakrabartyella piscis]
MYRFYLKQDSDQILLPVTPSELSIKYGNQNECVSVLNTGQVNILKHRGLQEIEFTILLPETRWSFVQVEKSFYSPEYFLNYFLKFKESQKPVHLIIFRQLADGTELFCGNTEVCLEEYTILEKGGEQGDFWVNMVWKEYNEAKSIVYEWTVTETESTLVETGYERDSKDVADTYTVQSGDTLWAIAKKEYGDGSLYMTLANNNGISNPDLIYPGQVLTL